MSYYLDTNICIYALKGMFPALNQSFQSHQPEQIKIPSIVCAELLLGAKKSQNVKKALSIVSRFLSPFEIIDFDQSAAAIYADIRMDLEKKGSIIGSNDLIIAATTMANGGVLVSHNLKEFKRVIGLKLEDWAK